MCISESTSVASMSVSIVTYKPDRALLTRTLSSLVAAFKEGVRQDRAVSILQVVLVDNSSDLLPTDYAVLEGLEWLEFTVLSGHGNVGYGRGHNLALDHIASDYHLILNPDVELALDTLSTGLKFLSIHDDIGLATPLVRRDDGGVEYLCRRYPTVLTLAARGFSPSFIRRLFVGRFAKYEFRDRIGNAGELLDNTQESFEPTIVSGCFMLYKTSILKQLGGFDPRYFLYFEDYDLSLRTGQISRISYVPAMRIVHSGGGAARKGGAHVKMFVVSAFRFFSRFGWKWF
jgi:GT2 family glycosyltransferase